MRLSTEKINEVIDFITSVIDNDDDDDAIRPNYSGRGMYGRTCFGFVTKTPLKDVSIILLEVINHTSDMSDEEKNDFVDAVAMVFNSVSMDSMGLKSIVYFPALKNNA